jgi:ADP-glucose pyrophosphorylase
MTIIRPFVKKELLEVKHFHTSGYESLFEFIPKEFFPNEYGGNAGSTDKLYKENLEILEKHKDYIMNDENWKILRE